MYTLSGGLPIFDEKANVIGTAQAGNPDLIGIVREKYLIGYTPKAKPWPWMPHSSDPTMSVSAGILKTKGIDKNGNIMVNDIGYSELTNSSGAIDRSKNFMNAKLLFGAIGVGSFLSLRAMKVPTLFSVAIGIAAPFAYYLYMMGGGVRQ